MHCVEVTLAHKADWWEVKHEGFDNLTAEMTERVTVILRCLAVSFTMLWRRIGDYKEDEWVDEEDAESNLVVLPDPEDFE